MFIFFETPKTRTSAPFWHDFCEDPVATRFDNAVAAWLRGALGVGQRVAQRVSCPMLPKDSLENLDAVKLQLQSSSDGILQLSPGFWMLLGSGLKPWIYSDVKAVKAN